MRVTRSGQPPSSVAPSVRLANVRSRGRQLAAFLGLTPHRSGTACLEVLAMQLGDSVAIVRRPFNALTSTHIVY